MDAVALVRRFEAMLVDRKIALRERGLGLDVADAVGIFQSIVGAVIQAQKGEAQELRELLQTTERKVKMMAFMAGPQPRTELHRLADELDAEVTARGLSHLT